MSWGIVAGAVVGAVGSGIAANKASKAQQGAADTASQAELEQFYQNRSDLAPWREAGIGALGMLTRGIGVQMPAGETIEQIRARLAPQYTNPAFGGNGVDDAGLDAAAQAEFTNQTGRRQAASTSGGTPGEFLRDFSMADYQADPGYQFRRDEGLRGIEGSAAGRGGLLSGATLKALSKYNSGLASEEFGNAYNRYNANLDRRFNRLSGLAGTGQTATRDVAQMGTQAAQNVGQNIIGAGNARASGYVGVGNAIGGAAQGIGNYAALNSILNRQQTQPWRGTPYYGGGTSIPGGYGDTY